MSDTAQITVEGDTQLAASLADVIDHLDDLGTAAAAAGRAVVARASQLAPTATGALAASIAAAVSGSDAVISAGAPYALYQEYGTAQMPAHPFMRPAVDASTAGITEAYAGEIQGLLNKVKGA